MPSITINGTRCDFTPGQTILQAANAAGKEIPQYCYHDGLSIVASCRICLGEVWSVNPKTGKLEAQMGGKLQPTCQTPAADGLVVYTDSPKAVANQKAVMEYLLINHPLDCPVCDQSGECFLQDYSFQYGRGYSRFEETKVKQPKKNLGEHVYLYSDRCIMCTRCVRFTREVTQTSELMVAGRGNKEEIDVFPGIPLNNDLSANVIDLCPVGALLDKDFLFAQRVWFLKRTPSIDPLTASGDNIFIEHNQGKIYRLKPRENMAVNKWWITDEVRYGWKFVHDEDRLATPMRRRHGVLDATDDLDAYAAAIEGIRAALEAGSRLALVVSPMLPCEEAYLLARLALELDPKALLAVGPVPTSGQDRLYPIGAKADDPKAFRVYAEKAPNARGVRRVLAALAPNVLEYPELLRELGGRGRGVVGAAIVTGNYPSEWATSDLVNALKDVFTVLIDTRGGALLERADVVIPSSTWAEKSGTFENARGMLQAFERAIPTVGMSKPEGQIALDLAAVLHGEGVRAAAATEATRWLEVNTTPGQVAAGIEVAAPRGAEYDAAQARSAMAASFPALKVFEGGVVLPPVEKAPRTDMPLVQL